MFSNTKRKELDNKQLATRLRIARAKVKLAATKLSLLENRAKKRRQELKEIAAIEELERLEDKAKIPKDIPLLELVAYTANLNSLDLEPLANLG